MKLVILDRDGVINHDSDDYIKSVDEWIAIDGSIEAIVRLNQAGYNVAVATNQSGISRGYFTISTLNAMHQKMYELVQLAGGHIDGVFFCPHSPSDKCECRKPEPGLLYEIADRFAVSLDNVFFIGDSISDIQAARNANAKPVLVRTGKGENTESKLSDSTVPVYDNLSASVRALLNGDLIA
ncbi:MAG: D-glycero-beta-D-manno-heptose 1,7-bisphosphate 7-phosphatase [Gammaproteobacteria bacterium]|jgi:D-glycero-D-manno-heptose 1,7-bisphosphate phosphatase